VARPYPRPTSGRAILALLAVVFFVIERMERAGVIKP
jgi:hypothetical protein